MRALLAAAVMLAIPCAHAIQPRSHSAKAAFQLIYHCPATDKPRGACPGYVIDHVVPLACGGSDDPLNMQWQTTADAKAKDRWERAGCASR